MSVVNVATLKARLSYYLKLAEKGKEVIVTSHKQQVARIVPVGASLTRLQVPSRPVGDLRKVRGVKVSRSVSAVDLLNRDRRRR